MGGGKGGREGGGEGGEGEGGGGAAGAAGLAVDAADAGAALLPGGAVEAREELPAGRHAAPEAVEQPPRALPRPTQLTDEIIIKIVIIIIGAPSAGTLPSKQSSSRPAHCRG